MTNKNPSIKDKALQLKASEMTGDNTSDPLEAFKQWEHERQALAELFDISQAQDIILSSFKKQWRILAGLIWGTHKLPGEFILQLKPKQLIALREAGEAIDKISGRYDELHKDTKKVIQEAYQLPLFQNRQGEKQNENKG